MHLRLIALSICAALIAAVPARADDYRLGDLTIEQPWARASAGNAKAGAAYLVVANGGSAPDRLLAADSPVGRAELHTHLSEDGVMKMRQVEAIDLQPGEKVVLEPGGLHVMLMGLAAPLVEGETFPLTLTFEKAGSIDVQVEIGGVASMHGGHGASTMQ